MDTSLPDAISPDSTRLLTGLRKVDIPVEAFIKVLKTGIDPPTQPRGGGFSV